MEALVHLDPEKCICVLGPQIAAHHLVATGLDPNAIPAVMSHRGLVEAGIRKLVDVDTFESAEDKQRKEALLKSAYELDPAFPAFKVAEKLRELGVYEQWLAEVFFPVSNRPAMPSCNMTLEHLFALQRQGLLLAYSHYDLVLTNTQRFKPVYMDSGEGVRGWATSVRSPAISSGLLYLHGSHGLPASLKWDSVPYVTEVGDSPGGKILKEICKSRTVIFVGFDADFFDPLLHKFCATFLPNPGHSPPLLLTSQPGRHPPLPSVLTVRVGQLVLEKVLIPVPTSQQGNATHLYRSQDKWKSIRMTLLYSNNTSGLNSADKIKSMSFVGATQIALTQDDKHHLLTLQVDYRGMESLWKVVFASASSAIHSGLLGVRLEGGVTVWLAGREEGGAQERSAGHPEVPTLPLHPSSHTSSSVSVISSNWTSPIPSPTVSKLASTPSPSTRPTLPSPLMNSTTKRSPLRGPSSSDLFRSVAVGTSHRSLRLPHHHQVRRIQSEHDKLSYLDRVSEEEKRRKNGMLIHQESAPAIIAPDSTQTLSVPSPSTLMKLQGSMNEHRIEYIDRLQSQSTTPQKPSSSSARKSDEGPDGGEGKPTTSPDFQQSRQQFINEAMEWSKKLSFSQFSAEMQKKWKAISGAGSHPPISTFSMPQVGVGGSGTAMSTEEQERLLRQHFEQMHQPPNSQAIGSHSSSSTLSLPSTSSKLPLGSLSVSSPQESPSVSRPRSKSPKPSPIQLPSSSTPLQGSSINPILGAQGLFGYMPPTSALQGLPGLQSPASLMFSPSSQYAAILNQYIQMMSPHSMAGGNKQQPVIINDPALLQGLQHAVIVLPDGTIAPANLGLEESLKKESERGSPTKPVGKRAHSPESSSDVTKSIPPPKRRRSSSLPDITQLSTSAMEKNPPIQENREGEEREMQHEERERAEEIRKRDIPPLSMITIPKEMKMSDPMLGFPTPPQSSPHFASSPLILPPAVGTFQPQPMTPITPSQEALSQDEIKELVGESNVQTPLPPSPDGGGLPPFPTGRGPIQLWQFLLDLLISPDKNHMIHWTGNGYEFRILQPEEIAKLWGARKNKPRMNYDKLSRGLRYYYSKGIMDKVPGKKLTFKYTCDVPHYLRSRGASNIRGINGHENTISSEA